jgi:hypothetical protein
MTNDFAYSSSSKDTQTGILKHQLSTRTLFGIVERQFRFCLHHLVCLLLSPRWDQPTTMSSAPLAQSADKQVLFARLGLTEQIHKILLVRLGRAK